MGMTAGSLGLCGPADELCPGWENNGPCPDPHCEERGRPESDAGPCLPYSPPAAVCGNGADGCPPQCCKAKSVEELGQQIVDAFHAEALLATESIPAPLEEAVAVARAILARGDGLLLVKAGTSQHWVNNAQLMLDEGSFKTTLGVTQTPEPVESILQEAERIVNGPRREGYGHPAVNFARIAHLWNGYLAALIEGVEEDKKLARLLNLLSQDICQMMIQLKQCRLIQNPDDRDGHTDIAGYAQCSKLISDHEIEQRALMSRDVD